MKPKFNYGDEFDPKAPTLASITRYARQRLGCEVPIGGTQRGLWYQRVKEELAVQGWTLLDLVRSIEYCASHGIVVRKIDGILFYVDKARAGQKEQNVSNLQMKVAEALGKETDETWLRKLSLAQGKALEKIYLEWEKLRGDIASDR